MLIPITEIDPAFYETRARLRTLADSTEKDASCTQCEHLHDISDRQNVMRWGDNETVCICPKCEALSYYDLTLIRI